MSFKLGWGFTYLRLIPNRQNQGAGRVTVHGPNRRQHTPHVIPDSREGWVESVRYLIDAYFLNMPLPDFDYSQIRPAGEFASGWSSSSACCVVS